MTPVPSRIHPQNQQSRWLRSLVVTLVRLVGSGSDRPVGYLSAGFGGQSTRRRPGAGMLMVRFRDDREADWVGTDGHWDVDWR
jgi:hypothetical protein